LAVPSGRLHPTIGDSPVIAGFSASHIVVAKKIRDNKRFTPSLIGGWLMKFKRITIKPNQMDGMACLRSARIPVATVVAMVADGMSNEEILHAYPDLEAEDIREALHFAAEAVRERELPLVDN
jgi:uncharacterized protein (DUF433 family)